MKLILLSGLCVLGLASGATAAPFAEPLGTVDRGGSWTEGWNLGGIAYDFVGIAMVSEGRTFAPPLMSGFSVSGWDLIGDFGDAPVLAASSGPLTSSMQFSTTFAGSPSEPLRFDMQLFNGDIFMGAIGFDWDGSEWAIVPADGNLTKQVFFDAIIPSPPGAGLLGMAMVVGLGRRRR
ncbi:MAG: hypothetical protein NXI14_05805 [bacterium]|nr:hypothetical protein [bacterium]